MDEESTVSEYEDLLQKYLEVCNTVLKSNQDKSLLSHLWKTLEESLGGEQVVVSLLDDRIKGKHAVKFADQKIHVRQNPSTDEKFCWKLRYSELQHVVEHADEYIQNPSKLDLSWLLHGQDTNPHTETSASKHYKHNVKAS